MEKEKVIELLDFLEDGVELWAEIVDNNLPLSDELKDKMLAVMNRMHKFGEKNQQEIAQLLNRPYSAEDEV